MKNPLKEGDSLRKIFVLFFLFPFVFVASVETVYIMGGNDELSKMFVQEIVSELIKEEDFNVLTTENVLRHGTAEEVFKRLIDKIQKGEVEWKGGEISKFFKLKKPERIIFIIVKRVELEEEKAYVIYIGVLNVKSEKEKLDYSRQVILEDLSPEDIKPISMNLVKDMLCKVWRKGLWDSKPGEPPFDISVKRYTYKDGDRMKVHISLKSPAFLYLFTKTGDLLEYIKYERESGGNLFQSGEYVLDARVYLPKDSNEWTEELLFLALKKDIPYIPRTYEELENMLRSMDGGEWELKTYLYKIVK